MQSVTEYFPSLFLSPIGRDVSCDMIAQAFHRANLGRVDRVSIRQGKHVDFAVVDLQPWNAAASVKCRSLLQNGGFWKIYYGKNVFWKARAYVSKPTITASVSTTALFVPQTPDCSPPSTPPPLPEKNELLNSPVDDIESLCENLEKTSFDDDNDTLSEVSGCSDPRRSFYDDVDAAQNEIKAFDYSSGGDLMTQPPRKRKLVKRTT